MATMLEDPTPQRNHIFLAVTIGHEQIEFAVKLHPDARIDRQNLERKIGEHWEREKLLEMVHDLPAGYTVGVTGGTSAAAARLDGAALPAVVAELAKPELPGKIHLLVFGRALPRGDATAAGGALVETAKRELGALMPIYQFIAWSRDNDYVLMREALKQEKQ